MKHRKVLETWQAKLGTSGLNPLEVMELQDAVRARKKSVILQGRKFLLRYRGTNHVFYKPEDDFVPCGWLDIQRLLED